MFERSTFAQVLYDLWSRLKKNEISQDGRVEAAKANANQNLICDLKFTHSVQNEIVT